MFNINRVLWVLQLRYDFKKNELSKNILMAFGLIAVIAGIMFSAGEVTTHKITFLYIAAATYAASRIFFGWTKNDAELSRWLSTPATEEEKWLAEWINSLLIIPLLVALPIVAAAVFNTVISAGNPIDWSALWNGLGIAWKRYLMLHPIVFFAAIYFRSAVVLKLLSCVMLLGLLTVVTVFAVLGETFRNSGPQGLATSGGIEWISGDIFFWLYSIFFWGLSYLRLRELEVA